MSHLFCALASLSLDVIGLPSPSLPSEVVAIQEQLLLGPGKSFLTPHDWRALMFSRLIKQRNSEVYLLPSPLHYTEVQSWRAARKFKSR